MEEIEIWKTIPGTNNHYEASFLGRIRSVDRTIWTKSRWNGMCFKKRKGQIIKGNLNKNRGYWMHWVNGKKSWTHKFIAETFLPKIKGKNQVNHKDGNRLNNRVENLEWVSCKENINHGQKRGSYKKLYERTSKRVAGSKNWNAILNEKKVIEIRKEIEIFRKNDIPLINIAKKYKVSSSVIYCIDKKITWKHI